MNALISTMTSPLVVGGTLFLVGLHSFNIWGTGWFNNSWFTMPVVGDVTMTKVLGTAAVVSGGLMLATRWGWMHQDEFVPLMAECIEGAKAYGHL